MGQKALFRQEGGFNGQTPSTGHATRPTVTGPVCIHGPRDADVSEETTVGTEEPQVRQVTQSTIGSSSSVLAGNSSTALGPSSRPFKMGTTKSSFHEIVLRIQWTIRAKLSKWPGTVHKW